MHRDQIHIGQHVKHTVRKFNGIVINEVVGDKVMIEPEAQEIKKLYPFGIEASISELDEVKINA